MVGRQGVLADVPLRDGKGLPFSPFAPIGSLSCRGGGVNGGEAGLRTP